MNEIEAYGSRTRAERSLTSFQIGDVVKVGPAYRMGGTYVPEGNEGLYTVVGFALGDYELARGAHLNAESLDWDLVVCPTRLTLEASKRDFSEQVHLSNEVIDEVIAEERLLSVMLSESVGCTLEFDRDELNGPRRIAVESLPNGRGYRVSATREALSALADELVVFGTGGTFDHPSAQRACLTAAGKIRLLLNGGRS